MGDIDDRPRCWYGIGYIPPNSCNWRLMVRCRTQFHNPAHRERMNHLGPPIPPDERIDAVIDR